MEGIGEDDRWDENEWVTGKKIEILGKTKWVTKRVKKGTWEYVWGVEEKRLIKDMKEWKILGMKWVGDGKWKNENRTDLAFRGENVWNKLIRGRMKRPETSKKLNKRINIREGQIIELNYDKYNWLYNKWGEEIKKEIKKEIGWTEEDQEKWEDIKKVRSNRDEVVESKKKMIGNKKKLRMTQMEWKK